MLKNKIAAKAVTAANFRRFGSIIDYPGRRGAPKTKNLFRVIVRQPGLGWRIAYLVVRDRCIRRLEQHPGSLESFEPVRGQGLIYVASRKDPASIKCFLLDKPVILKKGIWHGVVSISRDFDVKITENSSVKCIYWTLGFDLDGK
ncbi:MAG TPA: hypothetical protein DCL35_02090 [Candidatus Omnitrophica bacterium]|nr:hypothetical protein [Candidatus Omnitrophota bacterium]